MRYFTIRGTALETRPGGRPLVVPMERIVREDALWITPEGIRIDGRDVDVISMEDTHESIVTNPAFKRLLAVVENQRQWCFNMLGDIELFERNAQSLINNYIGAMTRPMSESERNHVITEYHIKARDLAVQ